MLAETEAPGGGTVTRGARSPGLTTRRLNTYRVVERYRSVKTPYFLSEPAGPHPDALRTSPRVEVYVTPRGISAVRPQDL